MRLMKVTVKYKFLWKLGWNRFRYVDFLLIVVKVVKSF